MRVRILLSLMFLSLLSTLVSCSSKKTRNEVNQEIAKEAPLKSEVDVYKTEQELLSETKNLSSEQKLKLNALIHQSRTDTLAIDKEILKTKTVLFKSLLDQGSSRAKINLLENQLLKLNRKKTRQSLNSYKEARAIVGKDQVTLDRTLNIIDRRDIHEF